MKTTGTDRTDKMDIPKKSGRIYFSKTTERRILFFMTLGLLGAGIITRLI